ncbi:prophage tail fiber N-terminal domain-containing protein [Serratia ureilytica]|uniref:GDSL-type esterase/lipase family protein n=1 Tax=Serratia ureilytica TaxID=300181 RepID=UPI0018A76513|nr:GDSL-type esterase/lipase family protein [Serratia ureilytica]MBF8439528.1 prophage tail fiber N-terminal domain-containing protein [Serratia ureilytica]
MIKISGVYRDPAGVAVPGVLIAVKSKKNTLETFKCLCVETVTGPGGEYEFSVVPDDYEVVITYDNGIHQRLGFMRIEDGAADGSLNDYLIYADPELARPPVYSDMKRMSERAKASEIASAESARESAGARDASVDASHVSVAAAELSKLRSETAVQGARDSKGYAENSANSASDAKGSADRSDSAAVRAETAEQNAQNIADANTYYTTPTDPDGTIAGIAGTPDGKMFRVAIPDGGGVTVIFNYYKNAAGVAEFINSEASERFVTSVSRRVMQALRRVGALESKTKRIAQSREHFSMSQDSAGNVLTSSEFGRFDAFGAGSRLAKSMAKKLRIPQNVLKPMRSLSDFIIARDLAGNVPIAIKDGLIFGKGIHKDTLKGSAIMSFTDGSSLWPYRSKVAKHDIGSNQNLRIITVGDSWMEWKSISQAIANLIYSKYGRGGDGWISFNIDGGSETNNCLNNVSIVHNGFTVYDASNGSAPNSDIGCSHDGFSLTSANQFATLQINGTNCNTLRINYYDGDGAFNYRVDGTGDWVAVVGGNTKTKKFIDITGLADGEHSLRINTTGNAGTVALYGFNADKPTGATLYKCGNGGMTTPMYSYVLPHIPHFVEYINPDVAIIIIGVNDYRLSENVNAFYTGYSNLIDAYRSVNPNMGIILISPPVPNATGATNMSVFNDAIRSLAVQKNAEFYSGYDVFPKNWADGDAAGLWFNNLHLNDVGAQLLATQNVEKFL